MPNKIVMITSIIIIVLIVVLFVSFSPFGVGNCKPETARDTRQINATSLDDCANTCHKYGLAWQSQAYGQSPDGSINCRCYTCFI